MSIEPQTPARTLTQMVATQIKLQMVLADDIKQSQLARKIGKTEQWLSMRLRGRQPIDLNDLALIAGALGVGVHELLPSPDDAARAADPGLTARYLSVAVRSASTDHPRDNRPNGRSLAGATGPSGRTGYLDRGSSRKRDR